MISKTKFKGVGREKLRQKHMKHSLLTQFSMHLPLSRNHQKSQCINKYGSETLDSAAPVNKIPRERGTGGLKLPSQLDRTLAPGRK